MMTPVVNSLEEEDGVDEEEEADGAVGDEELGRKSDSYGVRRDSIPTLSRK